MKLSKSLVSVLLLLFAVGILHGCDNTASHKARIYIFPDPEGKNALFVNRKPITSYTKLLSGGQYEISYLVKIPKLPFTLEIKANGKSVYKSERIVTGSYVVNLSENDFIWIKELSFGKYAMPNYRCLEKGGLGDFWLGDWDTDHRLFPFNQTPPESILSKGSSGTFYDYFFIGSIPLHMEQGKRAPCAPNQVNLAQLSGVKMKERKNQLAEIFSKRIGQKS